MSEELKPCPFCGSKAKIRTMYYANSPLYYVRCPRLNCPVYCFTKKKYKTEAEAIEDWNKRVPDKEKQYLCEALKDILDVELDPTFTERLAYASYLIKNIGEMREATAEEKESIDDYVKIISKK